jgi:hypothetical protein
MFLGLGLMLGDLLGAALDQLLMAGDLLAVHIDLLLMLIDLLLMDGRFGWVLLYELAFMLDALLVSLKLLLMPGNLPVVFLDLAPVFFDLAQMHLGDAAMFLFFEQIDVLRLGIAWIAVSIPRLAGQRDAAGQACDGGAGQAEGTEKSNSIDRHFSHPFSTIS